MNLEQLVWHRELEYLRRLGKRHKWGLGARFRKLQSAKAAVAKEVDQKTKI